MSDAKSRFKVKNGEIEIEYEGQVKDVNERYKEALEWLKSIPQRQEGEKKGEKQRKGDAEDKKKGTRGPEIWSPAIDDLIQSGFFKLPNKRTNKDVIKALEDKALPAKGKTKKDGFFGPTHKIKRGEQPLSLEIPEIFGKEKEHYRILKDLYAYSCGEEIAEDRLCSGIKSTITDWDKMMW